MHNSETCTLYPYLKTGRIYFNHAARSPLSSFASERLSAYLTLRSEGEVENFHEVLTLIERTKNKGASFINTTPDSIAFVDNTPNGLNKIAQGLTWKTGDRIILIISGFRMDLKTFGKYRSFVTNL